MVAGSNQLRRWPLSSLGVSSVFTQSWLGSTEPVMSTVTRARRIQRGSVLRNESKRKNFIHTRARVLKVIAGQIQHTPICLSEILYWKNLPCLSSVSVQGIFSASNE